MGERPRRKREDDDFWCLRVQPPLKKRVEATPSMYHIKLLCRIYDIV